MSKVTFTKRDLMEALGRVRHTVTHNKMIQLHQCFCFRENKVSSYNGQAGTITSCPMDNADFCIQADKFYKIVQSLFDEITLEFKSDKLFIQSGKNKTQLGTLPTKGFPEIIPHDSENFCAAENLAEMLRKVAFTIGTNTTKPSLLGVGISGRYVYSSDGHRITRATLDAEATGSLSIPGEAVEHICRLGQPDYMFTSGGIAGVIYGETKTVYITGCVAGNFPFATVDKMLSVEINPKFLVELPEDLPGAVDRVGILAPSEGTDLIIENTNLGLIVSAKTTEIGSARELLEWDYKEPFKFAVRPSYLVDGFAKTRRADLQDVVEGGKRNIRFQEDGFDHLTALMLLKEDSSDG